MTFNQTYHAATFVTFRERGLLDVPACPSPSLNPKPHQAKLLIALLVASEPLSPAQAHTLLIAPPVGRAGQPHLLAWPPASCWCPLQGWGQGLDPWPLVGGTWWRIMGQLPLERWPGPSLTGDRPLVAASDR